MALYKFDYYYYYYPLITACIIKQQQRLRIIWYSIFFLLESCWSETLELFSVTAYVDYPELMGHARGTISPMHGLQIYCSVISRQCFGRYCLWIFNHWLRSPDYKNAKMQSINLSGVYPTGPAGLYRAIACSLLMRWSWCTELANSSRQLSAISLN